jgi:hypothetical protein
MYDIVFVLYLKRKILRKILMKVFPERYLKKITLSDEYFSFIFAFLSFKNLNTPSNNKIEIYIFPKKFLENEKFFLISLSLSLSSYWPEGCSLFAHGNDRFKYTLISTNLMKRPSIVFSLFCKVLFIKLSIF